MKEKPIIFSGPMVRAILEGRKTQTRRVVKPQPIDGNPCQRSCPYGQPGDRLWVRETWVNLPVNNLGGCSNFFRADGDPDGYENPGWKWAWRSPLFMPRSESRLTLEVLGIRVDRVQNISDTDACAEGVRCGDEQWYYGPDGRYKQDIYGWYHGHVRHNAPSHAFRSIWNSIYDKRGLGWDMNPWVWVIKFRVVT